MVICRKKRFELRTGKNWCTVTVNFSEYQNSVAV